MKALGIEGYSPKPKRKYPKLAGQSRANRLLPLAEFKDRTKPSKGQSYQAMTQTQSWVADTTYIKLGQRFVYLVAIMCLRSRMILGWSLGSHKNAPLVYKAILEAVQSHPHPRYFHTDQGLEFTNKLVTHTLATLDITPSYNQPNSPWQNGFCESLF